MKRIIALAIGLFFSILPHHASAAFVFTISQVGDDVLVSGSGSINLAGLSFVGIDHAGPNSISPADGTLFVGDYRLGPTQKAVELYQGFPNAPFGLGSSTQGTDVISGDFVGFTDLGVLLVPDAYVSGALLTNSSTYENMTLASLGSRRGRPSILLHRAIR